MPRGRWWENLETNFAQRPEGFELSVRDWLRVKGTAAADIAMRTAAKGQKHLVTKGRKETFAVDANI